MIKSGTTLKGRYEIRDRIARGGFAVVYSAWDKTFERHVAVKVVDLIGDPDDEEAPKNGQELLREARFVANYRHPNVLDVYDFGDLDDQTYLVMPFADGGTLQQLLKSGPLTYEQADNYLQQISAGLDHAHRLKVVHRDLKPQNLLLFGQDKKQLVISDFGVAKALSQTTVASARITGTPRYMSPEQFLGRANFSSDIYSLGVILYQMLAGETPYKGDQAELLYAHTTLQPPLLSLKRPDAPPALDQLIQQSLAKDPAERPKSAGELYRTYHNIVQQMQYSSGDRTTDVQVYNLAREGAPTLSFTPTPNPPPSNSISSPVGDEQGQTVVTPSSASNYSQTPNNSGVLTSGSNTPSQKGASLQSPPPTPPATASGSGGKRSAATSALIGVGIIVVVAALIGLGVILSNGGAAPKAATPTATTRPGIIVDPNTTRPAGFNVTNPAVTTATNATTEASTTAAATTVALATTVAVTTPPATTAPATPNPFILPPNGDRSLTTTIEIWTDIPQSPDEFNLLNNSISGFKQLFPGVQINVKPLGPNENIDQKFPAGVQTNSGPDLVIAPVGVTGDWASLKVIRPISDLLDKNFLNSFDPNTLAASTIGGVTYGMPYNYGNVLVLYYNKKLAPTAPASFEELVKQAQGLTKGDNVQVGLALNRYDYFWLLPFLTAFGGWPVDDAGQVTLNTDAMRNTLQYFKDLADKNKAISPTLSYDNANALFDNGKLAFFINGDWELNNYLKPEIQAKVDLGIAPLPTINGRPPRSMVNPRHYYISSQSSGDRLKAATYFLQYLARPEQQKQLINQGLIPPTKEALNSPEVRNKPYWQAVISQLPDARVQPVNKGINKVWTAMNRWLEKVLNGTASPSEAAAAMQDAATR